MTHLFQISPFRPQNQAILPQLFPELQSYVYQPMVTSLGQTHVQMRNSFSSEATVAVMWPNDILKNVVFVVQDKCIFREESLQEDKGLWMHICPFLISPVPYTVGSPQLLSPGCLSNFPRSLLAFEPQSSFDAQFLSWPEGRMEIYEE